jgi:hypothetical protein
MAASPHLHEQHIDNAMELQAQVCVHLADAAYSASVALLDAHSLGTCGGDLTFPVNVTVEKSSIVAR